MAIQLHFPAFSFLDANGVPLSGGELYFYEFDTTTPLDTYSDEDLTSAHPNPIPIGSDGRAPEAAGSTIWLKGQDYKVIVKDSAGVTIRTVSKVQGNPTVSGDDFKVSPQNPADMTILVSAGTLFDMTTKARVSKTAQTSGAMTAPVTNPRIDVIYVDKLSGVIGITTGSEAASPSVPTIADGKLPLAQIALAITTTEIGDNLITDIRELANIGTGSAAAVNTGVADGNVPAMDATGYPAADGSQITNLAPLRGHIDGLILSNDGTDPAKDIGISAGEAADDGQAVNMVLASALIKKLDAAWAVGTNAGALDGTESVGGTPDADTWYHIWLIRRSDTGVVDILASENATSPTMPTNYDQKRRIGAVLFDATPDILAFTQYGDEFRWDTFPQDKNAAFGVTTAILVPLSVPTGIKVKTNFRAHVNGGSAIFAIFTSPDETDRAPSTDGTGQTAPGFDLQSAGGDPHAPKVTLSLMSNTSGQVRARGSDAVRVLVIYTFGWIDPRGRNA